MGPVVELRAGQMAAVGMAKPADGGLLVAENFCQQAQRTYGNVNKVNIQLHL